MTNDNVSPGLIKPSGGTAVMQYRAADDIDHVLPNFEQWSELDIFPTPPWGTRALLDVVMPEFDIARPLSATDPACGLSHMIEPMKETVPQVWGTDIHRYGEWVDKVHDFLSPEPYPYAVDWVITNPPFNVSSAFLARAFATARVGVAFLVRSAWTEGNSRYRKIWSVTRPHVYATFSERLPMCIGGYDPNCSTATSYAWFIWLRNADGSFGLRGDRTVHTPWFPIPVGTKKRCFRPRDFALMARSVPGWIAPSVRRRADGAQPSVNDDAISPVIMPERAVSQYSLF